MENPKHLLPPSRRFPAKPRPPREPQPSDHLRAVAVGYLLLVALIGAGLLGAVIWWTATE